MKVKQVPSVAASVPVNFGGAKREHECKAYSGFAEDYGIPITDTHNDTHTPILTI